MGSYHSLKLLYMLISIFVNSLHKNPYNTQLGERHDEIETLDFDLSLIHISEPTRPY